MRSFLAAVLLIALIATIGYAIWRGLGARRHRQVGPRHSSWLVLAIASVRDVRRHRERVVRGGTIDAAREELASVMQCGRLLPELPTWCVEHARGGLPAYWLIVDD